MQHTICLVEDDDSIRELLVFNLESEGDRVMAFARGADLFEALAALPADEVVSLFILDIMLPDMTGYDILKRLREDGRFDLASFLMLTALSSEQNKLAGFEGGADDYITKPFSMSELLARTRALIARSDQRYVLKGEREPDDRPLSEDSEVVYSHAGIVVNDTRHRVWLAGQEVDLTRLEYQLLVYLLRHPGFVLSRDRLLSRVWGYDYSGESRTVDVHIRSLRRELEEHGLDPDVIETVHGIGYRLREVPPHA